MRKLHLKNKKIKQCIDKGMLTAHDFVKHLVECHGFISKTGRPSHKTSLGDLGILKANFDKTYYIFYYQMA